MRPLLWLTVAVSVVTVACGYRFVGSARAPGSGGEGIEIHPLENESSEAGLERVLGDALVEEFVRRGEYRPTYTAGGDAPALVLGGTIRAVTIQPSAFSSVALALEYEIEMVVEFDLARTDGTPPVWGSNQVVLRERFLASADAGVNEDNKEEALQRMAAELAGRVHDALYADF
jgi:hypothetical protein